MLIYEIITEDKVKVFHGGSELEGRKFKLGYRTGEGSKVLGPGVYFGDDPIVAKMYIQHAPTLKDAALTTAIIDDTNVYQYNSNEIKQVSNSIIEELGYNSVEEFERAAHSSDKQGGIGFASRLSKLLGPSKAREMLIRHGVDGVYEEIAAGKEYCIFNTDVISNVKKVNMSTRDYDEHYGKPNKELKSYQQGSYIDKKRKYIEEYNLKRILSNAISYYYSRNILKFEEPNELLTDKNIKSAKNSIVKLAMEEVQRLHSNIHLSNNDLKQLFHYMLGQDQLFNKDIVARKIENNRSYSETIEQQLFDTAREIDEILDESPPEEYFRIKNAIDKSPERLVSLISKYIPYDVDIVNPYLAKELNDIVKNNLGPYKKKEKVRKAKPHEIIKYDDEDDEDDWF